MLVLEDDTLNASVAASQAIRLGASGTFAQLAGLVLRFCSWKSGAAPAPGGEFTSRAVRAAGALRTSQTGDVLADVLDLTLAAAIEFSRLQVSTAERLARCALRRAERTPMAGVAPAAILGRILYERGLVREAEQLLRPRLAFLRGAGSPDCVGETYTVLAAAAARTGDHAGAFAMLDEASHRAEARGWPRLLAATLAERVRLCGPDDTRRAVLWLEQLSKLAERYRPRTRCAHSEIDSHLSRARVFGYLKFQIDGSLEASLAQLDYDAWMAEDHRAAVWAKLAAAQCYWIRGDQENALRILLTCFVRWRRRDLGSRWWMPGRCSLP